MAARLGLVNPALARRDAALRGPGTARAGADAVCRRTPAKALSRCTGTAAPAPAPRTVVTSTTRLHQGGGAGCAVAQQGPGNPAGLRPTRDRTWPGAAPGVARLSGPGLAGRTAGADSRRIRRRRVAGPAGAGTRRCAVVPGPVSRNPLLHPGPGAGQRPAHHRQRPRCAGRTPARTAPGPAATGRQCARRLAGRPARRARRTAKRLAESRPGLAGTPGLRRFPVRSAAARTASLRRRTRPGSSRRPGHDGGTRHCAVAGAAV